METCFRIMTLGLVFQMGPSQLLIQGAKLVISDPQNLQEIAALLYITWGLQIFPADFMY